MPVERQAVAAKRRLSKLGLDLTRESERAVDERVREAGACLREKAQVIGGQEYVVVAEQQQLPLGDPCAVVARCRGPAVRLSPVGHGRIRVGQVPHHPLRRAVRRVVHNDDLAPGGRVVELEQRGKGRGERGRAPECGHDDADRRGVVGHGREALRRASVMCVLEEPARLVRIESREQVVEPFGMAHDVPRGEWSGGCQVIEAVAQRAQQSL